MKKRISIIITFILLTLLLTLSGCSQGIPTTTPSSFTLEEDFAQDKVTVEQSSFQYYAHPDCVTLNDGTVVTVYVKGHGKGALVMKKSTDFGQTWTKVKTPSSWAHSEETPTIYKLDFKDNSTKYILITGCPGWGKKGGGIRYSTSSDGLNYTEFMAAWDEDYDENAISSEDDYHKTIVAMSSLTRLKENGEFIDKWMGTFHNYAFVNYKSYLTFENGIPVWSDPEPLMPMWRDIEKENNLCELEIVRSPDGNELMMLSRNNSRKARSMVCFSTDEGMTWSEPKEACEELFGDRHKACYGKDNKLIIAMRGLYKDENNQTSFTGWRAWLGTYDDIKNYYLGDTTKKGEKTIVLNEDYAFESIRKKDPSGGYSGVVANDNGDFLLVGYGYFSPTIRKPGILAVHYYV